MRKTGIFIAFILFVATLSAQQNIFVSTNGDANAMVQQLVNVTASDIIRQSEAFLPSEQMQDIVLAITVNKKNNGYEWVGHLTQASKQFEKSVKNGVQNIDDIQNALTKDVNTLLIALITQHSDQTNASQAQSAPASSQKQSALSSSTPYLSFHDFRVKVRKEKGAFLDMESMAFKKYQTYKWLKTAGWISLSVGVALAVPVGVPVFLFNDWYYVIGGQFYSYTDVVPGIVCMSVGGGVALAGVVMLCCMSDQLHRSYQYYIQGQKREMSMDFHPVVGPNSSVGFGLTMRF